jgi:hypothetical protein
MGVSLTVSRPKATTTTSSTPVIIAKPLAEISGGFEFPICVDNFTADEVDLTGLSFSTGSPAVTGTANQLANVKIGSLLVTANGEADFAADTFVTAKPNPTTLTVSSNALQNGSGVAATATLTAVDATLAIVRVNVSASGGNIVLSTSYSKMNGTKVLDADGDHYDEVVWADGTATSSASVAIDFDSFASNIGSARTNT